MFLRIYELALQASYRAEFRMEQLMLELGSVIDQLWPNYERAALEAGLHEELLLRSQLLPSNCSHIPSTVLSSCRIQHAAPLLQ